MPDDQTYLIDKKMAQSTHAPLRWKPKWQRHSDNPILPPVSGNGFDAARCMNPWAVKVDDQWRLYYSGAADSGRQAICMATAPAGDPSKWQRRGAVLKPDSAPGAFDHKWCVLPHVIQVAPDKYHLYYTGNCGTGKGLSSFPGMGLATSSDGMHWEKYENNPILAPSGKQGDDDGIGIAGGSVLQVNLPDGSKQFRFYYTGCPTTGDSHQLDQQKRICLATSDDGIHWQKQGAVLRRDPERDYEDIAVAGPVVRQLPDKTFVMWYSAIGTRWGYYCICYCESDDGISWRRGEKYEDNLQLAPQGAGWEAQMVEYPSIIRCCDKLWMFYCGNGYGKTGIGAAQCHEDFPPIE